LEKVFKPNKKGAKKNQGKRARHSATKEATPLGGGWEQLAGSNELGYPHTAMGR
jgi:hypothetical protein